MITKNKIKSPEHIVCLNCGYCITCSFNECKLEKKGTKKEKQTIERKQTLKEVLKIIDDINFSQTFINKKSEDVNMFTTILLNKLYKLE